MSDINKPLVSVIMSVYNAENTLHEAIDSILGQTYDNWEFVICDDCSTDNSYNILLKYQQQFPSRFVILHNDKNMKLSYSLNRCLSQSKGEYIARMDADDLSDKNRFEKQVYILQEYPEYQVVGTLMQRFDENGFYDVVKRPEFPTQNELKASVPFCHATIMMRKSAYDAVHGYKVSKMTVRAQDVDMWFRFYSNCYSGYNIQEALYYVREDKTAIKRRTIRTRWNGMRIRFNGFRLLHVPMYWYIFPAVNFLKSFVPMPIITLHRQHQMKRQEEK